MLETLLQPNDTAERCGILLKDGRVVAVSNVAPDPTLGFEMNPEEVIPFVIADEVAATWHTHPNAPAQFSGEDYAGFVAWPDLKHYIIGNDGVLCYRIDNGAVIECA